MRDMIRQLEHVRSRARWLLLLQRGARLLAVVLLVVCGLVLIDFVLRLPPFLRALLLSAGAAALVMALSRWAMPALRFRPSLTNIALRIEALQPQLAGRLASAIDFVSSGTADRNPLAARSVREAERRFATAPMQSVVRVRPTASDVALLAFAAVLVTLLATGAPALAATGLKRLMLPFSSAEWPARTQVASRMHEVLGPGGVHPRGLVLPVRAENLTPDAPHERVEAHYRVFRENVPGAWKRVILTHQGGGIHERLLDLDGEYAEIFFSTDDARTSVEQVRFEFPPVVRRAQLTVTAPEYAEPFVAERLQELGSGTDARARLREPILIGSHVRLDLWFNKKLPLPPNADERTAALEAFFGSETVGARDRRIIDPDGEEVAHVTIEYRIDGSVRQRVDLVDAVGLRNPDPIEYAWDAVRDLPPSVTLLEPQRDMTVLPGARVELTAEAIDDVAVTGMALELTVQRAGVSEPAALPLNARRDAAARAADIAASVELGPYDLAPGDVVLITALAWDGWIDETGHPREPVRTAPRRLQVIGELDMAEQMRRQLGSVRQNAMRIETLQSELQERMTVTESQSVPAIESAAVARSQAQLVERIGAQRELVSELLAQAERNRMEDAQIDQLLRQSRDLLDFAGRAASESVVQAEALARRGEAATESEARAVTDRQEEVRAELLDLIALLDRDEDAWIVQRRLERMLERQQAVTEGTHMAQERTLGASEAELEVGEREELDRLALEQRAVQEDMRRLAEEMDRRARAMSEVNREAGEAMRRAARTADQQELDRMMEQAAERIERNQLRTAGESQESAQQTIERMLEELADAGRNRAEELLRRLSSLREVVERLIAAQENELSALAVAEETSDFSGRDRSLMRLMQNTRSATDEARAQAETRRVARRLQQAGDLQGEAVAALRAAPMRLPETRAAQERSLALLREALAMIEEQEQEAEEDLVRQQRDRLLGAYRELAERQVAIRMETQAIVDVEPSRRRLMEARRLANEQDTLRAQLSDLAVETPEIMDSEVFGLVHELMDRWAADVADALREGIARRRETERQRMIAESIYRQIEAIEEAAAPPPDFVDEQIDDGGDGGGGGGGGESGGNVLPPAAELQRLLGLQIQVRDETRRLDDDQDASSDERGERVRELGFLQREILRIAERMAEALAPPALQEPRDPVTNDEEGPQ